MARRSPLTPARPPLLQGALVFLVACAPSLVGEDTKTRPAADAGSEGDLDGDGDGDGADGGDGTGDGADGSEDSGSADGEDSGSPALRLSELVEQDTLLAHLEALQDVATANAATRETFGPGYEASVLYAVEVLESAGYEVTLQPFTMFGYSELAEPELAVLSPTPTTYTADRDHLSLTWSGSGTVEAPLAAVDLVLPPSGSSSSTSACEAGDFDDFPRGAVALVQRGTCTFSTKVALAEAAGASAVVVFNEGQSGRQGLEAWTLDDSSPATVPVVGTTFAVGESLAAALDEGAVTVRVSVQVEAGEFTIHNVLADTPAGDPERTVVVGAHLDSVAAGPGINDNGTGTAFVLAAAEAWATSGLTADNRIRWALWGAEEVGLVGSSAYVGSLSGAELDATLANLNYDMIGSPNGARFIYDGDGSATGGSGPRGSATIEALHIDHMESQGWDWEPTAFDGRSDYGPFIWSGIPAGGLFSGAESNKGRDLAARFGGDPDAALDACYHRSCDTSTNVDPQLFWELSQTAAHVVQELAQWSGDLGAPAAARVPVSRPVGPLPEAHGHGHHCGPVLQ